MNTNSSIKISGRLIFIWLSIFFLVLIWSGINPRDRFTWFLEVMPALMGLVILAATYNRFRFTKLAYWLILLHTIILMIGGHYTYAEVPLFNWLRDMFNLGRNHYDKVGHFAQGFVPAIIARELLIRKSPVKHGRWLSFMVICICLALSASYEFFEGGLRKPQALLPRRFLALRDMPGIHSQTCFLLFLARYQLFCFFLGRMTESCPHT